MAGAIVGCREGPIDAVRYDSVRVGLFGDSNTDFGWSDSLNKWVASSYVSVPDYPEFRLSPTAPNHPTRQLAGKIERAWHDPRPLRVVNHAIGGTNTGTTRSSSNDEPNGRYQVHGVTRFEGQVLGLAYPWTHDARDHVPSVQAFQPTPNDFVYISLGTNDCRYTVPGSYDSTVANLRWMVDRWIAAGLPASHVLLATIPPTIDRSDCDTPRVNRDIRAMATQRGVTLIDLSARLSSDDGHTWADPSMSIGTPDVHYREWVRARGSPSNWS